MTSPRDDFRDDVGTPSSAGLAWTGVVFALAFPTVVTWIYFVLAANLSDALQQTTYAAVKTVQFVFPVVWAWFVLKQPVDWRRPSRSGIGSGIVFGLAVTIVGWFLFDDVLRETAAFTAAAEKIRGKVAGFGLDSVARYATLGVFYSLLHSLLEEYYWRWFVFGQLRRLVPVWPAILVSAAGFVGHHVLVLATFFGWSWLAVLLSAAVGVGGVFWAWLYHRSGSLVGPWLSHLVVDAGIFLVGFVLLGDLLAG